MRLDLPALRPTAQKSTTTYSPKGCGQRILRVRIDAASKALPYEQPKPEFSAPAGDIVPLHVRIRAYARERAIQASDGKVVEKNRETE
jgi:hypothetical protein